MLQGGWALKDPADEHLRDGSKEIPFDILLFPKLCLAALADAVGIFSKPGRLSKILFHMPATYYECLLVLTDLTVIEELPDIRQLRSDDFKEILGGMTIALALGDAEKRRGPRRQDRRYLEDAPVAQLAIADLVAPPFHLEGGLCRAGPASTSTTSRTNLASAAPSATAGSTTVVQDGAGGMSSSRTMLAILNALRPGSSRGSPLGLQIQEQIMSVTFGRRTRSSTISRWRLHKCLAFETVSL